MIPSWKNAITLDKSLAGWAVVLRRWCLFNLVGLFGIFIQAGTLVLLHELAKMHYLIATPLAVEAAVLHNFLWHERWTWIDRTSGDRSGVIARLARFNLTTGVVSIVGNLGLMVLFVGGLGAHYAVANMASIVLCSVINFLVADRFVFKDKQAPGAAEAL